MRWSEKILRNHIDEFCEELLTTDISYNDLVIAYQDEWRKMALTHRSLARNMKKPVMYHPHDFLHFALPLEYHSSENKKTFESVILIAHTLKVEPYKPLEEYDYPLHRGRVPGAEVGQ